MDINYDSNKFKSGDHVICIDNDQTFLTINNCYIIKKINSKFVYIDSFPSFFACRFKLDESYYRSQKLKEIEQ